MPTIAQLHAVAAALDGKTSAHVGNGTEAGYWKRIAEALEEGAGASTTANASVEGYMTRAAAAAEAQWGGSGAEENGSQAGLLKRIVDAMELDAGAGTGSLPNRLATRSSLVAFAITLQPLTLSASTIEENSAAGSVIGAIQGTTSGSTLSIQSQENANWFAISGGNLVVGSANNDFEADASATVTIRETLAGATNTPRDTVLTVTVTDVPEAVPTTWNPADKHPNITLSNGDRRAIKVGVNENAIVRATTSKTTGKHYFENYILYVSGVVIGFADASYSLSASHGGVGAIGFAGAGQVYMNDAFIGGTAGFAQYSRVMFALDSDARKVWFGTNGFWDGDPAAGSGGFDISSLSATLFPTLRLFSGGSFQDHVETSFRTADFSYAPPTGFTAWGV